MTIVRGLSARAAAGPSTSGGSADGNAHEPMLAAVPYMGWNTYYGVGGVFDEGTILSVARSLLHRGLARAGYRIVWLDFGWASGKRDRGGEIVIDRRQWPHGLRWLTDWLHRHGLLAGIYTDAGKERVSRSGRRFARSLPAGRGPVRRLGVRRGQGRLLRRRPGRARAQAGVREVREGARR